MDCPWCKKPISGVPRACPSCGHAYDEPLRQSIIRMAHLEQGLKEIDTLARQTAAAVARLNAGLKAVEKQAAEEARMFDEAAGAFQQPAPPAPATPAATAPQSAPAPKAPDAPTPAPPVEAIKPPAEVVSVSKTPPAPKPVTKPAPRRDEGEFGKTTDFESAIGQRWLLIVGVVTTIFGVAYFLKYAIDQGWVSPLGRVAAAYAWGAAFVGAGHFVRKRGYGAYGLTVIGGGLAAWYFATFAAFQLYGLIGQTPAFLVMFAITCAAGALSVVYGSMWLSVLGLLGGFCTVPMLSTGANNYWFLFIYLTILSAGVLGIAYHRRWPLLHYLGFLGTYTLFTGWQIDHYAESPFWPAISFLTLYFLAYAFVPFAYRFFSEAVDEPEETALRDVVLIIVNSFVAFGLGYAMISDRFIDEATSVPAFFNAGVFAAMAVLMYRNLENRPKAFGVFAANAGLFLAVGIALLFSREWITVFWAVQAAGLFWAAARIGDRGLLRTGALALMVIAYVMTLKDYAFVMPPWPRMLHNADYTADLGLRLVLGIALLCSLRGISLTIRRYSAGDGSEEAGEDSGIDLVCTWAFITMLFFMLNREVSVFFSAYLPAGHHAAVTALWAGFALGLMRAGCTEENEPYRTVAVLLALVMVFKVFAADYAQLGLKAATWSFRDGYTETILWRGVLYAAALGGLQQLRAMLKAHGLTGDHLGQRGLPSGATLAAAFGGLLFAVLNIEVLAFFHDYLPKARFASVSLLWTAFSAGLITLGFRRRVPVLRQLAIGLFVATLLKVFLFDVANIDTPYRILSFIVLGAVLVGVSFLYHRFHDRLAEAFGADED